MYVLVHSGTDYDKDDKGNNDDIPDPKELPKKDTKADKSRHSSPSTT